MLLAYYIAAVNIGDELITKLHAQGGSEASGGVTNHSRPAESVMTEINCSRTSRHRAIGRDTGDEFPRNE